MMLGEKRNWDQMDKMKKAVFLFAFAFTLVVAACVNAAYASNFGPYSYVSHEVSVSYAQIKGDTWTWRFLNNSDSTTITYMAFKYRDKDGEHANILPGQLKPGAAFGGRAIFTASSRPTIIIKEIKRVAT
ncbi:hypothetical protein IAD21_04350 [Abditibacteriota bacterium]|nr:hypothetical protein IAD21_04350 [Abditibacteriota bacterium]